MIIPRWTILAALLVIAAVAWISTGAALLLLAPLTIWLTLTTEKS